MKTPRNPDRLIRTYLQEDQANEYHEVPEHLFNAIRDGIEQTRQRAVIGSMGVPVMNKFLAVGLGVAAVVLAGYIGVQLLGGPAPGGPAPVETPQPVDSAAPEPSSPAGAGLPDGPFSLWAGPPSITVTIAAPGWDGEVDGGMLVKDEDADSPDFAGMIVYTGDLFVYGDPCQWEGTEPDSPATTPEELVAALSAQALRDASEPIDITLDGHAGKAITLHVPDDAVVSGEDFPDCDQDTFGVWTDSIDGAPGQAPYRYNQGSGQIDEIWAVDVDGALTVIDWTYYPATPAEDVAEEQAIVESATFE